MIRGGERKWSEEGCGCRRSQVGKVTLATHLWNGEANLLVWAVMNIYSAEYHTGRLLMCPPNYSPRVYHEDGYVHEIRLDGGSSSPCNPFKSMCVGCSLNKSWFTLIFLWPRPILRFKESVHCRAVHRITEKMTLCLLFRYNNVHPVREDRNSKRKKGQMCHRLKRVKC